MFTNRRLLIALLTAVFAALYLRFRGNSHHETPSLTPIHPVSEAVETPYLAPFTNPNAPFEDDILPGRYTIHLTPGYSLDEHLEYTEKDRSKHVGRILSNLYKDKVVYIGRNIDETLLAKIRSDPKVEKLTYEYLGAPGQSPVHLAPLEKCDVPAQERVDGSYQVLLAPDHSFEKHSEVVGEDVESLLGEKYNFHTNKWVYSIKPVSKGLLKKIRSDPGVELVVCEQRAKRQTEGDLRPK